MKDFQCNIHVCIIFSNEYYNYILIDGEEGYDWIDKWVGFASFRVVGGTASSSRIASVIDRCRFDLEEVFRS